MGLVALKCPSCGAVLEKSDDRDTYFCEYCGSKMMVDKVYHEVSGTITIDGIAGVDAMLDRAAILIDHGEYQKASSLYERVLEISPRCARAYWGKMHCHFWIKDPLKLSEQLIDITEDINYQTAVKFAEGEEKAHYIEIGKKEKESCAQAIAKLKRRKRILRVILYASLAVEVVTVLLLYTDCFNIFHESLSLFSEISLSVICFIANLCAFASERFLVFTKDTLGDIVLDKAKYVLGGTCILSALYLIIMILGAIFF